MIAHVKISLLHAMLRGERGFYEIEKRYLLRDGSPLWVSVDLFAGQRRRWPSTLSSFDHSGYEREEAR